MIKCEDVLLDCNKKLEAVFGVSKSVVGVMDPNEVLNIVVYRLGNKLGYTLPAIFLFNNERSKLVLKKIGVTNDILESINKYFVSNIEQLEFSIKAKNNLVVKCARENRLLTGENMYSFVRPILTPKESNIFSKQLDVKLLVTVPLLLQGQTIGVMTVFLDNKEYIKSEKLLLQTFANQISISIYNAQLFSQIQKQVESLTGRQKDLESLLDLSSLTNIVLDKETVLQRLLDHLPKQLEHLSVLGGAVFLENIKESTLYFVGVSKNSQSMKVLKSIKPEVLSATQQINKSNILRTVMFEKAAVMFADLAEAFPDIIKKNMAQKIVRLGSVQSYVAVPVVQQNTAVGVVLFALKKRPEYLEERLKEILLVIGNYIADILEDVQLYNKLQNQYLEVEHQRQALTIVNEKLQAMDQAKSEFISIASHQLRTPLTVIRGYLSMILEGSAGSCDDSATDSIKKVAKSTDRLVALVNDLLDISKIEKGIMMMDRKLSRLELLAEEVVDELMPEAEKKKLNLQFHRPKTSLPHVKIDGQKIREVMMNMVDNAIKYTKKGNIDVTVRKNRNTIEFMVEDTGRGLSSNTIPQLFEKFSRGEGVSVIDTEGVGLGLFVAKKVIDAHEGKIWAEDRGRIRGSKFIFYLPITKKAR